MNWKGIGKFNSSYSILPGSLTFSWNLFTGKDCKKVFCCVVFVWNVVHFYILRLKDEYKNALFENTQLAFYFKIVL